VKTPAKKAPPASTKKAATKPAAPVRNTAAKSVSKPKAAAKPVASKAKGASKPVPAKAKTKAAPKTQTKSEPVKAKSVKQAKPVAPKAVVAKNVTKTPVRTPAKASAGALVKAPAKSSAKAKPVSPAKTKAAAGFAKTPAAKSSKTTVSKVPAPKPAKTVEIVTKVVPPVQATTPSVANDLPVRSSRPSARLAQITVPSLPPAVASTAAKASFLPQMSSTPLPVATVPTKKDPKLANNWKNKPVEQLSDAEMLAMPDSEYMNDVQMAFFRLKLVQLKNGILSNAGETTEHLREDTVVVPDPADRATIEEEHALELRTRDRERKLLKKIEQSIVRIDAGDYGYCDETGEPIGVGRLLARPTATLSLEAQQRRELKQKMYGD
jgi:DnaK suppressor protein